MSFDHKNLQTTCCIFILVCNFLHIYKIPIKLLGYFQIVATTSIISYFRCNDSDGDCHMKSKQKETLSPFFVLDNKVCNTYPKMKIYYPWICIVSSKCTW